MVASALKWRGTYLFMNLCFGVCVCGCVCVCVCVCARVCGVLLDCSPICAFQITDRNLNPSADKQILTQYLSSHPPLCLHFSFMFSHHYSAVIVVYQVHDWEVSAVTVEKYSNH